MKDVINIVRKVSSAINPKKLASALNLRKVSSSLNLKKAIREKRSIKDGLRRNPALRCSREHDEPDTTKPVTELDILRYRYQHGVNLGGIFVLEQFFQPHMFQGCELDSENEAVMHSIKVRGLEATKKMWEDHWASALSDGEIEHLANVVHCTAVRIPIGHWTIQKLWHWMRRTEDNNGEQVSVMDVYENAWTALMNICTRLHAAGIGSLIDLHGFGANREPHSGSISRNATIWELDWSNETEVPGDNIVETIGLYLTGKSVRGLTTRIPGCVGYSICNEAGRNARGVYDFYTLMIGRISEMDPTLPIYISDAADLEKTIRWLAPQTANMNDNVCPVIIDTHRYYCFSEHNKRMSPPQIVGMVLRELDEIAPLKGEVLTKGAIDVIVGEWSCAMHERTWGRVTEAARVHHRNEFGIRQLETWRERTAGHYFWMLKSEGEWDFFEQHRLGNIHAPRFLRLSNVQVSTRTDNAMMQKTLNLDQAMRDHIKYCTRTEPTETGWEHERYKTGWLQGWQDCMDFFRARLDGTIRGAKCGADRIGCLDSWIVKRMRESGQSGPWLWEWEHGFRKGVQDCERTTTYPEDSVG